MIGFFLIYLGVLLLVYAAARIVLGSIMPRQMRADLDRFLGRCLMIYAQVSAVVMAVAVVGFLAWAITK